MIKIVGSLPDWERIVLKERGLSFIEDTSLYNIFIDLINQNLKLYQKQNNIFYENPHDEAKKYPLVISKFNQERPTYYHFRGTFFIYRQDPIDIDIELYQLEPEEICKLLEEGLLNHTKTSESTWKKIKRHFERSDRNSDYLVDPDMLQKLETKM